MCYEALVSSCLLPKLSSLLSSLESFETYLNLAFLFVPKSSSNAVITVLTASWILPRNDG